MAEYDAFGRRIGEDPLAEAGWSPAGAPPPAPVATMPAPPAPVRRRSRSGARTAVAFTVLLLLAGAGAGVFFAVSAGVDAIEEAVPALPAVPTVHAPAPATDGPAGPAAAGLEAGSMIRRAAVERALDGLRRAEAGNVINLRVAAERIDVQLVDRGRLRSVQITPAGQREISVMGSGFEALPGTPPSRIDAAAPERLTRAAAERLGVPATRVDYLVHMRLGDQAMWSVFFKDGAGHFQADAAGRITRRIS